MVTENIEGRERYPVNVRYNSDFRDNVDELRRVLIGTPSGAQIPVEQVARIFFSRGPSMLRDEDGALTGYVYIDLKSRNYGDFVKNANELIRQKLHLPAGYSFKWAGEYEFELRAKERLQVILPVCSSSSSSPAHGGSKYLLMQRTLATSGVRSVRTKVVVLTSICL